MRQKMKQKTVNRFGTNSFVFFVCVLVLVVHSFAVGTVVNLIYLLGNDANKCVCVCAFRCFSSISFRSRIKNSTNCACLEFVSVQLK